ncbi:MAG: Tryptophan synthase subunit alpha [Cenarchaeum symbiont of Oopsacas minuta]|nr:Tryptophan synthase subunit alpha [Cenarchaeum symbiont of Oopsacas minuta]
MSRTTECFKKLRLDGRKALISYVMAGYPNVSGTIEMIDGMIAGGSDIIEIGFPFSDPLADGSAIQRASSVSLNNGMNLKTYFEIVHKVRQMHPNVPLFMMTYANILYSYGYKKIVIDATSAGLDGFIIPDISPEESLEYRTIAKKNGLETVFLVSPNTDKVRLDKIILISTGFLYMVAVYGTTGARTKIDSYTLKVIREAKKSIGTKIPIGAGFGIRTAKDAKMYAEAGADAVIIGSAYIKMVKDGDNRSLKYRTAKFTRKIKSHLDTIST